MSTVTCCCDLQSHGLEDSRVSALDVNERKTASEPSRSECSTFLFLLVFENSVHMELEFWLNLSAKAFSF